MRIRTVKPEFFTDRKVKKLEPWERLLFAGLWLIVDDEGRMEYDPDNIKGQLFPSDDFDIEAGIEKLEELGMIQRYMKGEDEFIFVRNLNKHQVINKPRKSKLLAPPGVTDSRVQVTEQSGTSPVRVPDESDTMNVAVTDESVWERKGKEEKGETESGKEIEGNGKESVSQSFESPQTSVTFSEEGGAFGQDGPLSTGSDAPTDAKDTSPQERTDGQMDSFPNTLQGPEKTFSEAAEAVLADIKGRIKFGEFQDRPVVKHQKSEEPEKAAGHKKPEKPESESVDEAIDPGLMKKLGKYFPETKVRKLTSKWPVERVKWALERTTAAMQANNVKKPASYMLRILRDDGQFEQYCCDCYAMGRADAEKRQKEIVAKRMRQKRERRSRLETASKNRLRKYLATIPESERETLTNETLENYVRENNLDLQKLKDKKLYFKGLPLMLFEARMNELWLTAGRPKEFRKSHLSKEEN